MASKNMERSSISLSIRETQIKTTMQYYYLTFISMTSMRRNWNLCIVGGNVKWLATVENSMVTPQKI